MLITLPKQIKHLPLDNIYYILSIYIYIYISKEAPNPITSYWNWAQMLLHLYVFALHENKNDKSFDER